MGLDIGSDLFASNDEYPDCKRINQILVDVFFLSRANHCSLYFCTFAISMITRCFNRTIEQCWWHDNVTFRIQSVPAILLRNKEGWAKYRRKGSCKQRNTKHTPTSHAKDTHTHTTTHTASLIHILVKIHERHTQSKGKDRSTALARSVVVTYYWGLKPVYVRTTSVLSPIRTL